MHHLKTPSFRKKCLLKRLLLILILTKGVMAHGQNFPVQSNTQLIPPYSVYLSDYATAGNEKLRVILVQRDLSQPLYQLRLVMNVEWNGKVIMRTSRTFNPAPISLNPGIPTVISGAELAPYLDSRNIDFLGYSREQYERTRALPEGSYRISFTAYDYRRQDVQVSNEGSSFYYLTKNEPPLVNSPVCGAIVPVRTPQQLVFSWLPRNTASPMSAAETQYEFSLYETRPVGRNPNDVVLTSQPIFTTTVDITQIIYGPSEPTLVEDMVYVWRIRAIDINGRETFRNNGYSEVCTFTYGGIDPAFNVGVPESLQAEGETERKAKIWWKKGDFDSYRVFYKKTESGHEWFSSNILAKDLPTADTEADLKLFDLEPDTEYETRIQARKGNAPGPYSEIVKFRTQELRIGQCGENPDAPQPDMERPFLNAIFGTIVEADDMEVQLLNTTHLGKGWYQGLGRVSIPYLGGATFTVSFENLYIDDNRRAFGRIDFLTKGVAAMAEEQLASQKDREAERIKEANRAQWAGTDFYEKIFKYDEMDIEDIVIGNASFLTMIDNEGKETGNAEVLQVLATVPEKAIIIEDKNGDQWVVQKDGDGTKVTKVEGGGLSPAGNMELSADDKRIIIKALKEIRAENAPEKVKASDDNKERLKKIYQEELQKAQASLLAAAPTGAASLSSTIDEIVFWDEDDETVSGNSKLDNAAFDFIKAEKEVFIKKALYAISADVIADKEYKLIASDIKFENKSYTEFLEEKRQASASEASIVADVKLAIINKVTEYIELKYE